MGLVTLNKEQEILDTLLAKEITVYEDVQGSKIFVNYDGNDISIRAKSMNNEPLSRVDLSYQKFYQKAYHFFESLPDSTLDLMKKNWYFSFQYFPDNRPANIEYDDMPKNGLVLNGICKGKKWNYTHDELVEWANTFGCEPLPIIFQGKLNDFQKKGIQYFLSTSPKDLEYVFGESNFAYFFYKLLNPKSESSFLMDGWQDNVEKLIISCDDFSQNFQILNPLYSKLQINETEFTEIYSLVLIEFLNFCQLLNIKDIKLTATNKDDAYIELVSKLFNHWVEASYGDFKNFEIIIPEFFKDEKFRIDPENIKDEKTKKIIMDEKLEYVYKILLDSLRKQKKTGVGLFEEHSLRRFNELVNILNNKILDYLQIYHSADLKKTGMMNFDQFYDLEYSTDSQGKVYPNKNAFRQELGGENKKKKGAKFK